MNRVNIASKSLLVIACLVLGVTGCASNNTIADNQGVEKRSLLLVPMSTRLHKKARKIY